MFPWWPWIDGILVTGNDSHLFSPLELIWLLFVYKYCVICAQHIDIDIHFSQREIIRVRAWNLAWFMFNNDILWLWSKIIKKWGTRCTFMLLNMTYILPPFWTRYRGVFKMVRKTLISAYLRSVYNEKWIRMVFPHLCQVWSQLNVFYNFNSTPSSHLFSVILLDEKPHFDRTFKFSWISKKQKFAGTFKYDF